MTSKAQLTWLHGNPPLHGIPGAGTGHAVMLPQASKE